jgi:hypothetical protein
MFKRLVLDNSVALVTIIAFLTALTIYVAFAWRALRMRQSQLARFENLPFETPTPSAGLQNARAEGGVGRLSS